MHAYQAAEGDPDSRQVNPPGRKFANERRREPCNIVDCLSRAETPRLPADLPDRAESAAQAHFGRAENVAADLDGQARDRRVRHLNDQGWAPGRPWWPSGPLGEQAVAAERGDEHAHAAAAEAEFCGDLR